MLVLTRKQNESIVIGEGIEIKIARIDRNQVRVGVTAPKYVPIYRKEIAPISAGTDNERPVAARFSYTAL
ncbi:MAG: carbon storage regulator CsrA [Sedimentisphaerales bacterium]